FLCHLSRDCNRPELARAAVAGALDKLGARHVTVHTTSQDTPNATLSLGLPRVEQPAATAMPAGETLTAAQIALGNV
ncbi:MAG: hypothetical protein N2689_17430, partial [Verrucomicrobiae bacterium]|nr:hypothetical protein [Verrucomicrobiae bacterium]